MTREQQHASLAGKILRARVCAADATGPDGNSQRDGVLIIAANCGANEQAHAKPIALNRLRRFCKANRWNSDATRSARKKISAVAALSKARMPRRIYGIAIRIDAGSIRHSICSSKTPNSRGLMYCWIQAIEGEGSGRSIHPSSGHAQRIQSPSGFTLPCNTQAGEENQ